MLKITPYLELDTEAHQLVDHVSGKKVILTFSESAVLHRLLLSSKPVCSKEELLSAGWPDRVVAVTSLTQCISTLRKKLDPYREVQLKTIARRGYQLHISTQSHVKMLAVNDAESMRAAIFDVSLLVKISGIVIALMLLVLAWYFSDYHKATQNLARWSSDEQFELQVGGLKGSAQLLFKDDAQHLHPFMWEKHLLPDTSFLSCHEDFNAFVATDGENYSMAICPGNDKEQCAGKGLINLTSVDSEPAELNLQEFVDLSSAMEQRIRYNRVMLPESTDTSGALLEHNYQADVYFPVKDELLIRADINMSLIYDSSDTGEFHSSSCITDQDCLTTPIKYKIRGKFKQYSGMIDGLKADIFQVKVEQKDLIKPDKLNDSAVRFYRDLRKRDIKDEEVYYIRIHQDHKTAVWIIPLFGQVTAWYHYERFDI
ncbi:winged helix-turn-helix domain-containing protein [Shewanella schlegeliana]|uniref:Winged helix-turn-helix domain-containing protein n=1 Tax=Shewanella schlegeliana TaxID=190308 RepID=A0ABS1T241_9GAMM|nr:winged helix-turn-helix domain-containing protein [Shewanella schlegeliana]MBL4914872.1 winged helix-turn-helix domain-containing protein [Shewanella schlegeliana]MCL1110437.1 winged helix-turn-helix domain-containing protein [Shewanella schlegeliana]GIU27673.1 CadC family transcriptional regulator [Shewanella schlegeliana]